LYVLPQRLLKFDNFELILYFKIRTETSLKSRPVRCLASKYLVRLQDLGVNRNYKENSPRDFHEPIRSGQRENFL